VDVKSVALQGNSLIIHGNRVALVATEDGKQGLERKMISSTTQIWPSFRHGDKSNFHASEEVQITVQKDSRETFDTALANIFADGLEQLAASVPSYWKCYATNYFVPPVISEDAEKKVNQCVKVMANGSDQDEDAQHAYSVGGSVLPPTATVYMPPKYSGIAGELMVSGSAVVHLRVGIDGIPVGLQVVRAIGAGLDEEALQAASQDRFKPATRDGIAAPVNINIAFRFALHQ